MSFFGLVGGLMIEIEFENAQFYKSDLPSFTLRKNPFLITDARQQKPSTIKTFGAVETLSQEPVGSDNGSQHHEHYEYPIYSTDQNVSGFVNLKLENRNKPYEHLGVNIEFIGRTEVFSLMEGKPFHNFISVKKELLSPGVLTSSSRVPFSFQNLDLQDETYGGRNICLRHFIRVTLERKFLPPKVKEKDIIIQKMQSIDHILQNMNKQNKPIKMEVGIEDCLHIEFEFNKKYYHLSEIIHGQVNFLLVRIKIKHMEISLIRRESEILKDSTNTETQTLVKYEIMDGAPVKGTSIEVKLHLKGVPALSLTPTYDATNHRFGVKYFLNLVLVDEEDRRYFKQQEVVLYRNKLG